MMNSTLYWAGLIKLFRQVEDVIVDHSDKFLDIAIRGRGKTLQVETNYLNQSLNSSNNDPWQVVISFLNKNGVLIYYQNTLVGYFDIQAYSEFIKITNPEEAISKISCLFSEIRSSSNTDLFSMRLDPIRFT